MRRNLEKRQKRGRCKSWMLDDWTWLDEFRKKTCYSKMMQFMDDFKNTLDDFMNTLDIILENLDLKACYNNIKTNEYER